MDYFKFELNNLNFRDPFRDSLAIGTEKPA